MSDPAAKAPVAKPPVAKPKVSPGEFIRQVRAEANKVVWPTRQETTTTAIFVGILMMILAVFFLGIDSAFGALVRWLLTLA
jgi:preprotein translocase subunit SecE